MNQFTIRWAALVNIVWHTALAVRRDHGNTGEYDMLKFLCIAIGAYLLFFVNVPVGLALMAGGPILVHLLTSRAH